MSVETNKAIVRRFIDEVVIGGNLELIGELFTADCLNHAATAAARHGPAGIARVLAQSRGAMPDQRWADPMLIAEGELVVVHATREATWQADSFRGVATPKGTRVAVELVHVFRFESAKIVEHWAVRDDLGLMQQLGVVPR